MHQFIIHGKTLGISRIGGVWFITDAREIFLKDFQFFTNERFLYEYNFFDHWQHEIRVEKLLQINPEVIYPCCIGGNRAAPPEDCGGPEAFMKRQDYYSTWRIEEKLMSIIQRRFSPSNGAGDDYDDDEEEDFDDNVEATLETLKYWINQHRFNHRAVNHKLQEYFKDNEQCRKSIEEVLYES